MPNLLMIALSAMLAWQEPASKPEILAPYYPTPQLVVQKMLEFGGLKAGETMFDLGSGDGRIVITAAQTFHANAIGVELDDDLARQSIDKVRKLGLEKSARIIHGDLLRQDYSSADLVTVYLLPSTINDKVKPMLERQLKKGARVVSHDFNFNGWKHIKSLTIDDDGEGRSHTLYLYVR
jgi:ubiquinone/menaquinone biosynthesis C-methylase UbiE